MPEKSAIIIYTSQTIKPLHQAVGSPMNPHYGGLVSYNVDLCILGYLKILLPGGRGGGTVVMGAAVVGTVVVGGGVVVGAIVAVGAIVVVGGWVVAGGGLVVTVPAGTGAALHKGVLQQLMEHDWRAPFLEVFTKLQPWFPPQRN